MAEDFISFEAALDELQMSPEELKALVASKQLQAFKGQDTLMFRTSDVQSMKKGRETEPTLVLPSGELDEALDLGDDAAEPENLELGDDFSLEDEAVEEESGDVLDVPTLDLSDDSQQVTEAMEFDDDFLSDDEALATNKVTQVSDTIMAEDDDSQLRTEALRFTDDEETEGDEEFAPTQAAGGKSKSIRGTRNMPRAMAAPIAAIAEAPIGTAAAVILIVSFLFSMVGFFIGFDAMKVSEGAEPAKSMTASQAPSGLTNSIAGMFGFLGYEFKAPLRAPSPQFEVPTELEKLVKPGDNDKPDGVLPDPKPEDPKPEDPKPEDPKPEDPTPEGDGGQPE